MQTLERDPSQFDSREFDVLVIGGGIAGAACAWDAALRGYSTALVEKNDFGAATSSGCFKIVHGGLRYLQHFDLKRLRESVAEQRTLRQIAPHLVHPLPFLIPTYGLGMKGKPALTCGLTLYELLSRSRNKDVDEYHQLPRFKVISKEECLRIAPKLEQRGLTGGVVYYDCQMSNCERLTWSVVRSAVDAGAVVANYLEAVDFSFSSDEGKRISSVSLRDNCSGAVYQTKAKFVVNASGPWHDSIAQLGSIESKSTLAKKTYSKGIQVVVPQFFDTYAVAIESRYRDPAAKLSRGGRSFFVHPWRGYSLVGTSDELVDGDPDNFSIGVEEVKRFVNEVRSIYDSEALDYSNVKFAFGGLRPVDSAAGSAAGEAKVSRDDQIIDHSVRDSSVCVDNMISVVGVKYTTFRLLGERVVDLVSEKISGARRPCLTKLVKLFGAVEGDYGCFVNGHTADSTHFSKDTLAHLAANYGSQISEVIAISKESPTLAEPLSSKSEVLAAEVVYAARNEMVCTLSDVALRRSGFANSGIPKDDSLQKMGELVGGELGWDKARVAKEIESVRREAAVGGVDF